MFRLKTKKYKRRVPKEGTTKKLCFLEGIVTNLLERVHVYTMMKEM